VKLRGAPDRMVQAERRVCEVAWCSGIFVVLSSTCNDKNYHSQRTPREAGGLLGWAVSKTASCD
jgi:hypothetical protein